MPTLAYSYIRFSDPKQRTGDSLRRQTEVRDRWLADHPDVVLDSSLRMTERDGVSAFSGAHRSDKHCLGQFLALVNRGRIAPGSFLLIENLDRLSREEVQDGLELVLGLLRAGVVVVQLVPVTTEFRYPADPMRIVMMVMELSRGNSESRMKVERLGNLWKDRRERAAKGELVISRKLPGWVVYEAGRLALHPTRVETLRAIYRMAIDGHGVTSIVQRLNREKVPAWGRPPKQGGGPAWAESVVYRVLTSRTVLGEYQPTTLSGTGGRRVPAGDPIPGYYPRAVSDGDYYAAQAALAARKHRQGRRGKHVNLFAGLLRDARDGGTMSYSHMNGRSYIFPPNGRNGIGTKWVTFPAFVFEAELVARLREVDPADVLGGPSGAAAELMALEGRLSAIDRQLATLTERLVAGSKVKVIEAAARGLELERVEVIDRMATLRQEVASPAAESLHDLRAMADPASDPDARVRLRAAIRRAVSEVWCLFVRNGITQLAAVQVRFAGGTTHRDYLIRHRPPITRGPKRFPGETATKSMTASGEAGEFDLRNPKHVAMVEKALAKWEPDGGGKPG